MARRENLAIIFQCMSGRSKEISVFVDESGSFDSSPDPSRYYIVCLSRWGLSPGSQDWEVNKLNDQQYNDVAHRCQALYERLVEIGRVSDAMADRFENEYAANMYAVND